MYAEFTEELVTGNEMIDEQHKELIGRINKLQHSLDQGNEKIVAVNTLDYLSDYVVFHFNAEEKLQEDIAYPNIDTHKAQHSMFKQTIKELQEMLADQEGPSDDFVKKVDENVAEWFLKHIQSFDRSVAEYKNMKMDSELL
ncbi:hemerythrin [Aequitasia blattaphilus]|uniref:Bacteriohemerythrin n=1 Tax=Aequitasia blattaphilus TaxID=2949332 RepID=A0ABT1EBP9_9FIRM|nr:bacteriohemerythrin [Aequitasia blattaphilus]MCP1103265.1 bacteriohemerythrin [Aequitasia blattaphilus]MCR8615905.1 bacteriohemerythrin [Aequitasia blattaphilus]